MFGTVIWFGRKVLEQYKQNFSQRLDKVSIMVVNDIKESFGSPTALPEGGVKDSRGKAISAKKWRQGQHSAPGEPPFVQTGTLRRSITYNKINEMTSHIGSTLKPEGDSAHSYAYWLEIGNSRMKARPYLRPAILRNKKKIMEIIKSG